eukprot:277709-Karenia_brevis.AAC.1
MRTPRRPYRALRLFLVGVSSVKARCGVVGGWKGLWSPKSVVNVVGAWSCRRESSCNWCKS